MSSALLARSSALSASGSLAAAAAVAPMSVAARSAVPMRTPNAASAAAIRRITTAASFAHRTSTPPRVAGTAALHTSARRLGRKFGDTQEDADSAGAGQAEEGKSDKEKEGNGLLGAVIIIGGVGAVVYGAYLGVDALFGEKKVPTEAEEAALAAKDNTSWGTWLRGILLGDSPLLPSESLDALGRRPRTVVLSFDQTLVHCGWSRAGGWEVRKRPGVDQFIERLHLAGYELVLWANMPSFEVEPTLAELDPLGYFKHKLYNESTNFKITRQTDSILPFKLVKDLGRLQRDPKRLIVIDVSDAKYSPIGDYHNVLKVAPFVDDIKDGELPRVLKVLEDVRRFNIHDVTKVVDKYNATNWQATPTVDLFDQERRTAAEAIAKLAKKPDDATRRERRERKEQRTDEATTTNEPTTAGEGWGSWIKRKTIG